MVTEGTKRLIMALDTSDADWALDKIRALAPFGCGFKLGNEIAAESIVGSRNLVRECVDLIRELGGWFFVDQKPHDIKNTNLASLRIWLKLKPKLINIHAVVGTETMKEVAQLDRGDTKLIAVTVLTDKLYRDLAELGMIRNDNVNGFIPEIVSSEEYQANMLQSVVRTIAEAVADCGLDGIISSAEDLPVLRIGSPESQQKIARLLKVTPGIRLIGGNANDQKRVSDPYTATINGADFLVAGRPLKADNPVESMLQFAEEVDRALAKLKQQGGAS
ncbi:MAG: orotidine 5'-phosphate decarboxylase / HUMPS family protein [Candidatus Methylomirabilota bacterium]